MKICVLIPAFNESGTIGDIVKELKSMGLDVLVVDDGSADGTVKIARESGALTLEAEKHEGKGASLRRGFEYVLKNTDCDAVITMDADNQHSISDIARFIEQAEAGKDFVVGNRMLSTRAMPLIRLMTNKTMSKLLSMVCRQDIPDTQCGFRLFRRKVLESLRLDSSNYDIESEMLIKASRKGFLIESVPVETIYGGQKSLINPVVDSWRFFLLLLRASRGSAKNGK